jgi:hypothetical protein
MSPFLITILILKPTLTELNVVTPDFWEEGKRVMNNINTVYLYPHFYFLCIHVFVFNLVLLETVCN